TGDDEIAYMAMPQDMRTYAPHLPEVDDAGAVATGTALMRQVAEACDAAAATGARGSFDLGALDAANRAFVADLLGEGEVSVKMLG
ncbi:hypothetical protein, partial [Lactococcus cremoris]|uniref:hypothetical protein n=1 Tax=Lactococcus lactis subsp. cremoris TaxID=1359 RepID=UPI003852D56F